MKSRQAKAELGIAPQSNTTPTVTLVKTIVQSIARVMNLINSLAAISVYVGGCNCMLLVPMKTKHSHFCFYSGVGSVAAVAAIAATLFWPKKKKINRC